jgi:hypothetical protein
LSYSTSASLSRALAIFLSSFLAIIERFLIGISIYSRTFLYSPEPTDLSIKIWLYYPFIDHDWLIKAWVQYDGGSSAYAMPHETRGTCRGAEKTASPKSYVRPASRKTKLFWGLARRKFGHIPGLQRIRQAGRVFRISAQ